MFVTISVFTGKASAASGLAYIAIPWTFPHMREICRIWMINIPGFHFDGEHGEIVGIYKRHSVPFTKHDVEIGRDRGAAVRVAIIVNYCIVFRIGPKHKIRMRGGNLTHAAKIIRVVNITGHMPAEKLICAAAGNSRVNAGKIRVTIF